MTGTTAPRPWALIVGASSGFGEATSLDLAREGLDICGAHSARRSAMRAGLAGRARRRTFRPGEAGRAAGGRRARWHASPGLMSTAPTGAAQDGAAQLVPGRGTFSIGP